jgi:hypothetical protein
MKQSKTPQRGEKKEMINFHRLGRLVILNEEMFMLSEKRFIQIFQLNKEISRVIDALDERKWKKRHQNVCNKIRRYGKLMGFVDRILRDD